ncbi:sensor domain-containing protein [Mycobacterium haemophilum]|uniref:sensor domain-containing protein n=1 Tax=Mycobacterium haemophilum TaxID=29311 RepID=UPI0006D5C8F3|nr:sensor domain-containing protein [Mycobacterium haemophilum]
MIDKAFNGRYVFFVCGLAIVLSACSHPSAPAKPTTAASRVDAKSLIISVADVIRIANFADLTPQTMADLRQPSAGNMNAPGPCRAVGNSVFTFAGGWTQFRGVSYSGTTDDLEPGGMAPIDQVSQAVAVYPNDGAARVALDQLATSLTQCAALHDSAYDFALERPDPATLRLSSVGWSHQYHVKSSVLMSIGVLGLEPADEIAGAVLQAISDRID